MRDWLEACDGVKPPQPFALRIRQAVVGDIYHAAEGERRIVRKLALQSAARRDRTFD